METNDTAGISGADAPPRPPLRIFINYRHEDVPFAASALYRELKGRFGAENIFFDAGTLRPGMEFLEEITSRLSGTAGAFLALIGPEWLPTMEVHRRRGDNDYVAQEIDLGMRNGWTVIPVLLNDAPLPEGRDLPLAIKALPRHHVARVRQTSLDADVEDLIARLDEISSHPDVEEPSSVLAEEPSAPDEGADAGTSEVPTASGVPAADDEHYQMLVDEVDNLVIFLGAGANADDRDGPFRPGASMLPDDADIAEYLAVKARLRSAERELAEVAQYARMIRGEPRVYSWVKVIFAKLGPGPVHRYLARLPRRLEERGWRGATR